MLRRLRFFFAGPTHISIPAWQAADLRRLVRGVHGVLGRLIGLGFSCAILQPLHHNGELITIETGGLAAAAGAFRGTCPSYNRASLRDSES